MNDSIVRARVTSKAKQAAMDNARALGLDLSTVIRMVINNLAIKGELPENILHPNQETIQAIKDLENGVEVNKVDNVNELKKDIGW